MRTACMLVGCVVALAGLAAPAGADFLQEQGSAGRLSSDSQSGPEWPDVALRWHLPGVGPALPGPLIIGDAAYVPVIGREDWFGPGIVDNGLWRIPFDGTAPQKVIPYGPPVDGGPIAQVASDGKRIFVVDRGVVQAYALDGGSPLWSTPLVPDGMAGDRDVYCASPPVRDGMLYVACQDNGNRQAGNVTNPLLHADPTPGGLLGLLPVVGGAPTEARLFLAALGTVDGRIAWEHTVNTASQAAGATGQDADPACAATPAGTTCKAALFVAYYGLTLAGPYLMLSGMAEGGRGIFTSVLLAFHAENGAEIWDRSAPLAMDPNGLSSPDPTDAVNIRHTTFYAPGDDHAVYWKEGNQILELNPARGGDTPSQDPHRALELGGGDPSATSFCGAVALDGPHIYAASPQTIYAWDARNWPADEGQTNRTSLPTTDPLTFWVCVNMQVHGDTLYAHSSQKTGKDESMATLYAFDKRSLATKWVFPMRQHILDAFGGPSMNLGYAVSGGVLVAAGIDGNVTVFGKTPASPAVGMAPVQAYPPADADVTVDLGASRPGAQGGTLAYAADWGDGNATAWQDSPVLGHHYGAAGDREARFFVKNGPQSASETLTFHVGAQDPVEVERQLEAAREAANATVPPRLNVLQEMFAPDKQNATFFVLGLLVTAVAAAFGLLRVARRRSRLRRELHAVAEIHRLNADKPLLCERLLAGRRAHVARLHLDGKLDEAQLTIVEKRIDEVVRAVRTGTFEGQLDFLPYGLVKMLRRILEDSHVLPEEVKAFHSALDKDRRMTDGQKTEVRAIVDGWFRRDQASP